MTCCLPKKGQGDVEAPVDVPSDYGVRFSDLTTANEVPRGCQARAIVLTNLAWRELNSFLMPAEQGYGLV